MNRKMKPDGFVAEFYLFSDTAYFDNVVREKERYHHPSLELVAEKNNQIVGLIDIEYEKEPGIICSNDKLV